MKNRWTRGKLFLSRYGYDHCSWLWNINFERSYLFVNIQHTEKWNISHHQQNFPFQKAGSALIDKVQRYQQPLNLGNY